MFNCSCCGTELTSPYFFNGGVYGYTCIKKLNPSIKRNKSKQKCFKVDILSCVFDNNRTRTYAKVLVNGVKGSILAFREYDVESESFSTKIELQRCSFYDGAWWVFV